MGSTGTLPYSLKNGTCEQLAQSLITVLLDYHHNANKAIARALHQIEFCVISAKAVIEKQYKSIKKAV